MAETNVTEQKVQRDIDQCAVRLSLCNELNHLCGYFRRRNTSEVLLDTTDCLNRPIV